LYKRSQGTVEECSHFFCQSSSAKTSVRSSSGLLYGLHYILWHCRGNHSSVDCACLL